jgi:AcrR family transcriptional regulator
LAEITLDAIAARAGVSVQTVLRQFGSRDGLFAEAIEASTREVAGERRTPPGDVDAAVRTVVDHYERMGRASLLILGQETFDDWARRATDRGKAEHRVWVRDAFSPATDDEVTLDLLVVATDVYTWKLLRLDRALSRALTERRMHALVDAVLKTDNSKEH